MMKSLTERFEKRYVINLENNCWIWQGTLDKAGYGKITFEKKSCYAHRISYLITYGFFPNELYVCHHCDNPSCVNPKHLFLGTIQDNTKDMIRKKRSKFPSKGHNLGVKNPHAKLTEKKVKEIKSHLKNGLTCINIAKIYSVSRLAISNIKRGTHWKHI